MITLHRLGHDADEPFYMNPDLILTVEANPDTVITLTTGSKVVVAEAAELVADKVRDCRVQVLTWAMRGRREDASVPSAVAARRASQAILTLIEPPEGELP
jgi:flagellar protein FlbD